MAYAQAAVLALLLAVRARGDGSSPDEFVCSIEANCSGNAMATGNYSWSSCAWVDGEQVCSPTHVCYCQCKPYYGDPSLSIGSSSWAKIGSACSECAAGAYESDSGTCDLCVVRPITMFIMPIVGTQVALPMSLASPDCLHTDDVFWFDDGNGTVVETAGGLPDPPISMAATDSTASLRIRAGSRREVCAPEDGSPWPTFSGCQNVTRTWYQFYTVQHTQCPAQVDLTGFASGLHLLLFDHMNPYALLSFMSTLQVLAADGTLPVKLTITYLRMMTALPSGEATSGTAEYAAGLASVTFWEEAQAWLLQEQSKGPWPSEIAGGCSTLDLPNTESSAFILFSAHADCVPHFEAELLALKEAGKLIINFTASQQGRRLAADLALENTLPGFSRRMEESSSNSISWAPYFATPCGLLEGLESLASLASQACDGSTELSFFPLSVPRMTRGTINFPRGCEATECCVNGLCAPFVQLVSGVTQCTIPALGTSTAMSVVLKNGDVEMPGASELRFGDNLNWAGSVYEHLIWNCTGSSCVPMYQGTYKTWISVSKYQEPCCRLVAIGMDFELLGSLSEQVCPDLSSVQSSWVQVEVPPIESASASGLTGQIRTVGWHCWSEGKEAVFAAGAGVAALPPLPDETFAPLPPKFLEDAIGSGKATFMDAWAAKVGAETAFDEAFASIQTHFICPALRQTEPWPANLWWSWSDLKAEDLAAAGASECWIASPWSTGVDAGVRCCYDAEGVYLEQWPSRVLAWYRFDWTRWQYKMDLSVETLACVGGDAALCAKFLSVRPPVGSTNNVFGGDSKWTMPRPVGGGWGDPHCQSIDGASFECNFRGEAVWAGCGNFTVHAVAEQVGTAQATIITKFAVRSGDETVEAKLDNTVTTEADPNTGLPPNRFLLKLNGEAPSEGESADEVAGAHLTISSFNNDMTIQDDQGNTVKASFLKQLVVLQVGLGDDCFNASFGLSGNNNANKSDDLVVKGTGQVLDEDSSSADIYNLFVKSWLVTTFAESLFVLAEFIPGDTSFAPIFIEDIDTSNCPSACNGDKACCFDADQGGDEFVEEFQMAVKNIEESNSKAVKFDDNLPPAFDTAPSVKRITVGSSVTLDYIAIDAVNVTRLTCDVCPDVDSDFADTYGVACEATGLNTQSAMLRVTASSLPVGNIRCVAEDDVGANATALTKVMQETTTLTVTTATMTVTATATATTLTATMTATSTATTATTTMTATATATTMTATATATTATATTTVPEEDVSSALRTTCCGLSVIMLCAGLAFGPSSSSSWQL
mmetsp:Transcript_65603/g.170370  ORF Transcript_65603/g.170370 Transcript_65603/m.170370 type:complete len:1280 (+) Transcript_65603:50-3889(+)